MSRHGWVPRLVAGRVDEALSDTRVVAIAGARQVGKSTLADHLVAARPGTRLISLDDPVQLTAAREDPVTFVRHDRPLLVIDEVQRAPELLLPLKLEVDRDPRPGRYLLTGSAQLLSLPQLADSLAGRLEVVALWPFTQGELERRREQWLDAMFDRSRPRSVTSDLTGRDYLARVLVGGFPEAVQRPAPRARRRWYESYLATFVRRDIAELAAVERIGDLDRLLRLSAARTATVLNLDGLARDASLSATTLRRYFTVLETAFLVLRLPGWFTNRTSRLVKAPKLLLTDTGLAAHLVGIATPDQAVRDGEAGRLLETFVANELIRQAGWAEESVRFHHFRSHDGTEVDLVLEAADGRVVGVEVKLSATVRAADLRGLRLLEAKAGRSFHRGVLLYGGDQTVSFGPRLVAMPIASIWTL